MFQAEAKQAATSLEEIGEASSKDPFGRLGSIYRGLLGASMLV